MKIENCKLSRILTGSRFAGKINLGFTLFELLVVISIIAIITAVGVASYSSAQKRARDARRKQDMQAIQKAFEQYYASNDSVYPDTRASAREIMPAFPLADPKSGDLYDGQPNDELLTTGYCICAELDILETGNSDDSCTFVFGVASGDFYCVSNLQ